MIVGLVAVPAPAPGQVAVCTETEFTNGPLRLLEERRSPLWTSIYDGPASGLDTARPIASDFNQRTLTLSPDGATVYATGQSMGTGTGYDFATFAYDATSGARRWMTRFEGDGSDAAFPTAIASSADGSRVFVTGTIGTSEADGPDWEFAAVAYDARTGEELWASVRDVSRLDRFWSIVPSPAGSPRVYLAGESGRDLAVLALDAETGERAWAFTSGTAEIDVLRRTSVSPDGDTVFVTGLSRGAGRGGDYVTLAIDAASGERVWETWYDRSGGDDWAFDLAVGPSLVYVTGFAFESSTHYDAVTLAYDRATGEQVWLARYNGGLGTGMDVAQAVEVSADGRRVIVTGYSVGCRSGYDFITVAYDAATGTQQWASRFNGTETNATDQAQALVISPEGSSVYITGASTGGADPLVTSTHYDAVTVGYDAATGVESWVARFDGAEHFQDAPFAISVAPDGKRVFIHGETWHSTSPGVGDLLTAAYSANAA
jgi:hypothetical protein